MNETDEFQELVNPSRLKIERAKKHVADLQSCCQTFLQKQPFELWSRVRRGQYKREIFVKQQEVIPDDIALILGDVVHNLKSALDILAWRMVGDKAPNPKRVLFPFAETEDGLKGSIGNRQTALAGEKVVKTIKALKPYLGGDEYLYGIQALDTSDKHHFIITTAQVSPIVANDFRLLGVENFVGEGIVIFNLPTGQTLISQPIAGNRAARRSLKPFEMKEDHQPTFKICFGPKQGFDVQPVIETSLSMIKSVENAVQTIGLAYCNKS
ncbi:hypothetical protein [Rhizobium tumorigenes]|uniref:hypothetical protein n=1 Tax=Rhizobium tumorigenes TaxID=2041385 RepID=UPI00241C249E|nr:hypothetical protein [Rhizobium tumorigenes]WFS02182.1 hypothetical protein PR016_06100 [Rhizobium tumorigenes]